VESPGPFIIDQT